jgi:hypothetical protein
MCASPAAELRYDMLAGFTVGGFLHGPTALRELHLRGQT